MQISESDGVLTGKIVELLEGATEKTCSKCEGDLKDKPLVGMRILWDLKKEGDEWSGGKIFNPADGGTYTGKAKLTDGGNTLDVTGSWMFIKRAPQWRRVEWAALPEVAGTPFQPPLPSPLPTICSPVNAPDHYAALHARLT